MRGIIPARPRAIRTNGADKLFGQIPTTLRQSRRVAPPLAVSNDRTPRKCSRSRVTSLHTKTHVTADTAAARVLGVTSDRGKCSRYRVERWSSCRTFGIVSSTPRGVAQFEQFVRTICPRYLSQSRRVALAGPVAWKLAGRLSITAAAPRATDGARRIRDRGQ